MGENLALNIEEHGFSVAVWNCEGDWIDRFLQKHPDKKFTGDEDAAGVRADRSSGRAGS